MIKEVGMFLRQSIPNTFNSLQELPLPPLPSNFQNNDSDVPEPLKKILGFIMFGSNMSIALDVHTANGIMLQDFQDIDSKLVAGGELPEIQEVGRSKEWCLAFNYVADLPDCFITNRKSPDFVIVRWTEPDSSKLLLESSRQNLL